MINRNALVWIAWTVFVSSFFLTAYQGENKSLGIPLGTYPGWVCFWISLTLLKSFHPLGFVALLNVFMLVVPFVTKRFLLICQIGIGLLMAFGLMMFLVDFGNATKLKAGFYLWLVSPMLMFYTLWMSDEEDSANTAEEKKSS